MNAKFTGMPGYESNKTIDMGPFLYFPIYAIYIIMFGR